MTGNRPLMLQLLYDIQKSLKSTQRLPWDEYYYNKDLPSKVVQCYQKVWIVRSVYVKNICDRALSCRDCLFRSHVICLANTLLESSSSCCSDKVIVLSKKGWVKYNTYNEIFHSGYTFNTNDILQPQTHTHKYYIQHQSLCPSCGTIIICSGIMADWCKKLNNNNTTLSQHGNHVQYNHQ